MHYKDFSSLLARNFGLERRDTEAGIEVVAELEPALATRLDGYSCE
jgi:hypothetical protein